MPKGLIPIKYIPSGKIIQATAGGQIWTGDCLILEDGYIVSRIDCRKAKWIAMSNAQFGELLSIQQLS